MFNTFILDCLTKNRQWGRIRRAAIGLLLGGLMVVCQAQTTDKNMQKADALYSAGKYPEALKRYQNIVKEQPDNGTAMLQTARCFLALEQYTAANESYAQLFYATSDVEPLLFLEYGTLLMKQGKNDQARSYFTSYNNLVEKNDLRALRYVEAIENYDCYFADSAFVKLEKSALSTSGSDGLPCWYGNRIFFTTNEKTLKSAPLNRQVFRSQSNGPGVEKVSIPAANYTGMSIASGTDELFTIQQKEGQSLLQRCFIEEGGSKLSRADEIKLNGWDAPIFGIAANTTGSMLILCSESVQGAGGKDLYRVSRNSYGYGTPVLLEGFANSMGDEADPFILNDSMLFFSSNGHGGVGGFDIFYINLKHPEDLPHNLGFPINSRFDEHGLAVGSHGTGYVVSNRAGSGTLDDLYFFTIVQQRAWGEVVDRKTGNNLKNVGIDITSQGESASQFALADNGHFSVVGAPGESYHVAIWKEGYLQEAFEVNTTDASVAGLYEVDMGRFKLAALDKKAKPTYPQPAYFTQESLPLPEPEPILLTQTKPETAPQPVVVVAETKPVPLVEPVKKDEPIETIAAKDDKKEEKRVEVPKPEPVFAEGSKTRFRLQIAASRAPLTDQQLRSLYQGSKTVFMYTEEGWYKYAIGEYETFYQANTERLACGVKGAFIAAYRDEIKQKLPQAIAEVVEKSVTESLTPIETGRIRKRMEIYFSYNETGVEEGNDTALRDLTLLLQANATWKAEIIGHADATGKSVYNLGLAQERARSIQRYLEAHGIAGSRITIQSKGETGSKSNCTGDCTSANQQENRRAEIILYE